MAEDGWIPVGTESASEMQKPAGIDERYNVLLREHNTGGGGAYWSWQMTDCDTGDVISTGEAPLKEDAMANADKALEDVLAENNRPPIEERDVVKSPDPSA